MLGKRLPFPRESVPGDELEVVEGLGFVPAAFWIGVLGTDAGAREPLLLSNCEISFLLEFVVGLAAAF